MENSGTQEIKKERKKKAMSEEVHSANVRLELNIDHHLLLEHFIFKIKKRCLKELNRKPPIGLQRICLLCLELILKDKEFRDRIEGLLIERGKAKLQAK